MKQDEHRQELLGQLERLICKVPECVNRGSIQLVREWKAEQAKAAKVAKKARATDHEIESAISAMRRFI